MLYVEITKQTCIYSTTHMQSQTLYLPKKQQRSYLFGSRHLTYDMPFPIDECTTEAIEFRRRPSKRGKQCISLDAQATANATHKDVFRANSLEVDSGSSRFDKMPVVRNVSSPTTLQYTKHR